MTFPRVIGIGSHHGDDQAGWLVIDRLKELGYPRPLLRKAAHPADLLDDLSPPQPLFICDACQGNDAAGAIRHWRWPADSLIDVRTGGTHDMPLPHVLELAHQLSGSLEDIEIWGIDGVDWSPGTLPSPAVQAATREVAAVIWRRCHA